MPIVLGVIDRCFRGPSCGFSMVYDLLFFWLLGVLVFRIVIHR